MWFDMAKDRVSLPSRTSDVSSLADSLMTSHAYKKVRSQRFRQFEVFEPISANGCQVHRWWTCTNPICSTTNLSIHFGDDDEEPDLWANLFSPTGTDAAHASKWTMSLVWFHVLIKYLFYWTIVSVLRIRTNPFRLECRDTSMI